ncbi:MAG: hypothetical protein CL844_03145 [Crocinitomicaceae bacterium]|nr:hypothetical protein [Crocinitomicaceae bacterium]|tara:strand:- start:48562 stop:50298 length:1737 start_codon:yes stop_codon:yes gene_type:complete
MKILLFILFPCIVFSQTWNQSSSFIGPGRHHPITFSNDDFGFVFSGSYLNDAYKYDKLNDVWMQLQDIPFIGRGYSYGVTIGNKAYMGFGSTDNGDFPNDWWEYNMDTDTWFQLQSFPGYGRNHPAMIPVNNKIYVGCGSNSNGNLGDWWEYDVITDEWSQKSDFIGYNRHHPYYFGIGDYAYVGFGHGSNFGPGSNPSSSSYIYNDFYRYDPNTDSWLELQNFPSEARVAGTQFSFNGKGYILSGDGDDHGPLDTGEFWEYSPDIDTWTQLSSHPGDAIWAPGSFVIGCDVYFLLGQNTITSNYPTTLYNYKLSQSCGCTDTNAVNYDPNAISDDGSCCYVSGCTDPYSVNYDSLACFDDGSCIAAVLGCQNPTASNFNPAANVSIFKGGLLDNTTGDGSYFYNNQYLIFNSSEECVIKSAEVYAESNNIITFEIRDNNGVVIDDTTLSVSSGKQKINLNFDVPNASDLQLGISANNSGLYRNSSGANYPYNIGNMINITGSSASLPGYYYFYYNIEVEAKCFDISTNNLMTEKNPNSKNKLIKITDVLGKEVKEMKNTVLFYIYSDGSIEKKMIIE